MLREIKSDQDIEELYKIKGNQNRFYSYISGYGGLVGIDFDWEWPYEMALRKFKDRMNTRTIRTANGGYRVLYRVDDPKDILKFKTIPPHVEIHGNEGKHHLIVYGTALNDSGKWSEYKVIKDVDIQYDPEIIDDLKQFLEDIEKECKFLRYPCIAERLKSKKNELTQNQRLHLSNFLCRTDLKKEDIIDFFRTCSDFNSEVTEYQLNTTIEKIKANDKIGDPEKRFNPPKCETLLRDFEGDSNQCNKCSRRKTSTKDSKKKDDKKSGDEKNDKTNLATLIAEHVQSHAELFTDEMEIAYARFKVRDHFETWPINSRRFGRWLYKIGMEINNDNVPYAEAISGAKKYLEAVAFEGEEIKLNNRVAKSEDNFWYDLSNKKWQAVRINVNGWEIINNPPAIFKRQTHQKPQVDPVKVGNPWKIFDFINIPKKKKLLVLVYIISTLIPNIPHPVMIIFGPQGSGKSLLMEIMRDVIDPSRTPKLKIPKGDKDIVQNFDHHYAPFFDNLDTIRPWLSDIICRAVTGEGCEFRSLYTDDDAVIRSYRRCVALNGINVAASRGDLLDRGILLSLESILAENRLDEDTLRSDFNSSLPQILGGILDILSKAMEIFQSVKLKKLPRMADFAKWGYAIAEALGSYGKQFLEDYESDETERTHETVDANPVATAILTFMENKEQWEGSPRDLLLELEEIAESEKLDVKSKLWPKVPAWVTRRLNEIEPSLKTLGITYENDREGDSRIIRFSKVT